MTSCKLALFVLIFIATSLFPTPALSATSAAWDLRGTTTSTSSNTYPGARHDAPTWVSNGTLYMFSGVGKEASSVEGYLSSIYNYNLTTNKWTLSGGATALNNAAVFPGTLGGKGFPGGRFGAAQWTDSAGFMWLFGGMGVGNSSSSVGLLNDLWRYNPKSNEWNFMGGNQGAGIAAPGSTWPTPRSGSACWVDLNGNFWIFGGNGMMNSLTSTGMLTDMWYYAPTQSKWTNYFSDATPNGRTNAASWADKDGNGWIYGGRDASSNYLSDLWQFRISDLTWYLKSGTPNLNQIPTYPKTLLGQGQPGGLHSASTFRRNGDLFLFGGYGLDSSEVAGATRDLWRFNITSLTWTYVWGTPGTRAGSSSTPGARSNAVLFHSSGTLLIFGGSGYDTNGTASAGTIGDTWRVTVCSFDGTCSANPDVSAESTGTLTTGSTGSLTSGATKATSSGGSGTASGVTAGTTGTTGTTANTTGATGTTTGGKASTATTGSTTSAAEETTTAATVTVSMGMTGDPLAVNTSSIGASVADDLGVPPEFITITIVFDNGTVLNTTSNGGKKAREVRAAPSISFKLVISIFFPNSSAIAAVTGGAPVTNMTAQLATLQSAVTAAANSSEVRATIASSGATITSVTASTQSEVVTVPSATTGQNWPYTTQGYSAASALSPSSTTLFFTLLVVFACSWALL